MRRTRDAVMIAAAMSLFLTTCGDDDDSGDAPATSEAAVAEDTTAESAAAEPSEAGADASALDWVRVPGDDAFDGGEELHGVTAGGPGLVAVGSDDDVAAVWTSPDGLTWTRVATDDDSFGGEVNDVVAAGPGLVAVGSDRDGAAVWTSPDGLTWTRVPHDLGGGGIHDVTVGGPGLVAVGGHELYADRPMGAIRAVVWTSPDGLNWTRVPHDDDIFGGVEGDEVDMTGVTAGGPGLVAVGSAVWTSPDGLDWSRVPVDESVFGGVVPGGRDEGMTSVVAADSGIVAVGSSGGHAAVWTSPDGLAWSRAPHDDAVFALESMEHVTTGGSRYVAVGGSAGLAPTAGAWTSRDGLTWTAYDDTAFENGYLYGATTVGSRIVAVGTSRRCAPLTHAPVWLAGPVDDIGVSPADDPDAADTTAPPEAVLEDEAVLQTVAEPEDGDHSERAAGTWTLVASGDGAVMGLDDVVTGGPGFVAVGAVGDLPAVWTSADGVSWTRSTDVPQACVAGPGFGGLSTVVRGGPGFVAMGGPGPFGLGERAVWTSPDGLSWTQVGDGGFSAEAPGDATIELLAVGPGLVAVATGDGVEPAVWTSPDGVSWTRVADDPAASAYVAMSGLTEGGPGLVAVGAAGGGAAVWTSPDGLSWTRVPENDAVFSDAAMSAVVTGGPGLVAVGHTADDRAAVWTSPDGLTWTRLPDDAVDVRRSEPLVTVVEAGGHLVAIGEEGTPWYSTDGTSWTVIPHDDEHEPPGHGWISSVTSDGNDVVAVGVIGCPRCRAAVWNFTVPD